MASKFALVVALAENHKNSMLKLMRDFEEADSKKAMKLAQLQAEETKDDDDYLLFLAEYKYSMKCLDVVRSDLGPTTFADTWSD